MLTMQQVRQKYPQYSDMSDEELAEKLHQKYYRDMPREDFYAKIGMISSNTPNRPSSLGLKGIAEDITQGAKEAPGALLQGLKALPGELYGAGQQLANEPGRFGQNILAGTAEYGHGLLNLPANIAGYLSDKDLLSKELTARIPRQQDYDYAQMVGLEGQKPGDVFLRGLPAVAGMAPLGEIGELSALGRTGARMGALGAQAAVQEQNPVTAALTLPLAQAGISGAGKAINAARGLDLSPSGLVAKRFGEGLSREELLANQRAAEGTSTGLGNVIGSPALRGLEENYLPSVPFGPGDIPRQTVKAQVEGRAQELMENLRRDIPEGTDPNFALQEALQKAYQKQKDIKNELYRPVNELQAQENFRMDLPTFKNQAQRIQKVLNESALKLDPDMADLYRKATIAGADNRGASILEAKLLRDSLIRQAKNLETSTSGIEKAKGAQIRKLADYLMRDMKEELKAKASPELQAALKKADENYKNNFSQWLDELDLTRSEKSPETLINEIKKSGKELDKFERIQKIQKLLPEEDRNIIGYGYLQKALDQEGNLQAPALRNKIDALGNRQIAAMFPEPDVLRQVLDFKRLAKMNENKLTMANPLTGQKIASYIPSAQVSSAFTLTGLGHPLLGAAELGIPAVASRMIAKQLQSEKFRSNVIDKMIKEREKSLKEKSKSQKELEKKLTIVIPYASQSAGKKEKDKK